jgi:hypothetical protein
MVLIRRIKRKMLERLFRVAVQLELRMCEKMINTAIFDRELSSRIDCLLALKDED